MNDKFKYGIGFWLGAGVYSLINMILNLKHVTQNEVLTYNYLITGVAVFGLILNIFLLKKATENKLKALPSKETK
ncbi:MAG TPA: hypothetical protein VF360_04035 [Candidatus Methanoperedens sp.]